MSGRQGVVREGWHICPGPECHTEVPRRKLACVPHWGQVTGPHQRAVYAAWDQGRGAGTMKHLRAMSTAIGDMTPLRQGGRG